MSQIYLNGPSIGCAISAEEWAHQCPASPSASPACGCGGTAFPADPVCPGDSCGQGQQMVCCCHPVPAPAPQPPQVEEGCCCKRSFHAALGLLCNQEISSLLDFGKAAFLTNTYSAGADLTCWKHSGRGPCAGAGTETGDSRRPPCPPSSSGASDNLGTLTGSFRRFAPCTCDLLDIEAKLHTAEGRDCGFTAIQTSLCQLDAVVIQAAAAAAEGVLTAEEAETRNFRCVCQRLSQRLAPSGSPCGGEQCACPCDGLDCCCAAGLLGTLAQNNLSRRVSLTAGLLVLRNVTLLGTVGNVLVLSNDADNRLYFVCVNSVQFIG